MKNNKTIDRFVIAFEALEKIYNEIDNNDDHINEADLDLVENVIRKIRIAAEVRSILR